MGSDFRRYWVGEALSNLGTRTGNIAYPLLALQLTGSPAQAGLLSFLRSLPWFVLSLPVGALVDRVDRRRLMIACDLTSCIAVSVAVLTLATHTLTFSLLLGIAVAQGASAVVFSISEIGAVRHLVTDENMAAAVAQNSARDAAALLAGPPLGGLLYAIRSFLPFVFDAFSFLASAAMLASIRRPFHEARELTRWTPKTHLQEIREGLVWVWRQPFVRLSMLLVAGTNFTTNAVSFLLVIVARERGATAPQIGLMLSCGFAGVLLGSVAATRLHRHVSTQAIMLLYPAVGVVAVAAMALHLPPLALGALYGAWIFFGPTWDAVVGGRRILLVPDALQGRVQSVGTLVSFAMVALGPLVGGVLVDRIGGSATFLCVAAFTSVVVFGALAGRRSARLEPVPA